jgi:hypothetical protein
VIVGDWGTGLQRARHVARHMAEAVNEATAEGREAHVIHLGDVYYSGVPAEYDRHVLADGWWPVTTGSSAGSGATSTAASPTRRTRSRTCAASATAACRVPSRPPRDPLPPPAIWAVTGSYEADGQRWGRFGFAVLDFAGNRIDVTYRDDAGAETHSETIS